MEVAGASETGTGVSEMIKPNFFIIGAPKCGTTSLAHWLSRHPDIFLAERKEPNYFNTDEKVIGRATSTEYERLFSNVKRHHRAIGEASTRYLSSGVAVSKILEFCDEVPRFIVCLRNPVDMVISLHRYHVQNGIEPEPSLEKAWDAQGDRRKGFGIPLLADNSRQLLYADRCLLGDQVERLLSRVPSERVLLIRLDDMRRDSRGTYLRVLEFLDVPDDGCLDFPVLNRSRAVQSRTVVTFLAIVNRIKRHLHLRRGLGIGRKLKHLATNPAPEPVLADEFRKRLRDYFRDDLRKLERVTGLDLREWFEEDGEKQSTMDSDGKRNGR